MYYVQIVQLDELLFCLFWLICSVCANFLKTQLTIVFRNFNISNLKLFCQSF